jgi:aminoglycoside/choline kinase family phosphotransferase
MTSKKDEVVLEILNKQLSYFDKTVDDVKDNEKWYEENSFTEEQFKEWKNFSIELLRKKLKFNKTFAEKQFMWINLMWGFKVKENEI